jgi:nucleoside-diphosphate-sugar epimerase
MAVLLTGASGFIGGHVRDVLRRRSQPVCLVSRSSVDDLSRGETLLRSSIEDLPDSAFDGFDSLIHLAWDGLNDFRSERHITEILPSQIAFLDRALASGLDRLVVGGTCLEYGRREGELLEESPTQPTIAYAIAKDRLRSHLLERKPSGSVITWCRIFYPFGPGQAASSLYSAILAAALAKSTLHMSHGAQRRDFVRVEWIADRLCRLALDVELHGVVNLSMGRSVSVNELVEVILKEEGLEPIDISRDLAVPEYEAFDFWGSNSKLESALRSMS